MFSLSTLSCRPVWLWRRSMRHSNSLDLKVTISPVTLGDLAIGARGCPGDCQGSMGPPWGLSGERGATHKHTLQPLRT